MDCCWCKTIVCVVVVLLCSALCDRVQCQLYYVDNKVPALPAAASYPGPGPDNVNYRFETNHPMMRHDGGGGGGAIRGERASEKSSPNMIIDFDDQVEPTKPTYFEPPMSGTKTPYRPAMSPQQMNDYRPIRLPIFRRHFLHYMDVPTPVANIPPTTVEIGSAPAPLNILFRSSSTPLNIQQLHEGAMGSFKKTESTDEAHVLRHHVVKPVINEIFEVITPIRRIKQEIKPVEEVVETVVAREQDKEEVAQFPLKDEHPPPPPLPTIQRPPPPTTVPIVEQRPLNGLEEQVMAQIGHEYMLASSNSIMASVYGPPAMTTPNKKWRFYRTWQEFPITDSEHLVVTPPPQQLSHDIDVTTTTTLEEFGQRHQRPLQIPDRSKNNRMTHLKHKKSVQLRNKKKN